MRILTGHSSSPSQKGNLRKMKGGGVPAEVLTVKEYWKAFMVWYAVENLVLAWESQSAAKVRHAWRPLPAHLVPVVDG